MQVLSLICAGLGIAEEDKDGKQIGYSKGDTCLGTTVSISLQNIKEMMRHLIFFLKFNRSLVFFDIEANLFLGADNLKDLLRFLRRDDPQTREVFKQVCKWSIVSKDLIPIVQYCQDDRNLVLNAG